MYAIFCQIYDSRGGLHRFKVDYEDFDAFNGGTTAAVDWLVSFTKQLRAQLPASDYIITHAPVAPWFVFLWDPHIFTSDIRPGSRRATLEVDTSP